MQLLNNEAMLDDTGWRSDAMKAFNAAGAECSTTTASRGRKASAVAQGETTINSRPAPFVIPARRHDARHHIIASLIEKPMQIPVSNAASSFVCHARESGLIIPIPRGINIFGIESAPVNRWFCSVAFDLQGGERCRVKVPHSIEQPAALWRSVIVALR